MLTLPRKTFPVSRLMALPAEDRPSGTALHNAMRGVSVARFLISGPAHQRPFTQALPVAEISRAALMAIYGSLFPRPNGMRGQSAIFGGKDAAGVPLHGHTHAHFFITDEDADGLLDHLTVFASGSFDASHQAALGGLHRLWLPNGIDFLTAELAGMGRAEEMAAGPLGTSRVWESATPYLATRFGKGRSAKRRVHPTELAKADLAAQLALFTAGRGVGIEAIAEGQQAAPAERRGANGPGPRDFTRSRLRRKDNGGLRACGYFRIEFSRPMSGPLALGHNSHFGMGLFVPAGETPGPAAIHGVECR